MATFGIAGECRVRPIAGTSGAFVVEPPDSHAVQLVITGFAGDPLPPIVHDLEIGLAEAGGGLRHGVLRCGEGEFAFQARGVERLERRPGLFDPLLAGFSLRPRDRLIVRGLLRRWHVSRQ